MTITPSSVEAQTSLASTHVPVRPLLKWAGGKTQMLPQLMEHVPHSYGKYIEPFIGGGALFFRLNPHHAVIADSNPELIGLYRAVAEDVEAVIGALREFTNTEETFYRVRTQDWRAMTPASAAARTIFLNRTCFNGLYRVNRRGEFNVPYGRYKNPRLVDEENLRRASKMLGRANIICGDYLDVLRTQAAPGDFIFLDPPYVPIGGYADFKRYTKEQFGVEDHRRLAKEVRRLVELECSVVLTNSNTDLVHELYCDFPRRVVQTRRYINSDPAKRTGEDVIVHAPS